MARGKIAAKVGRAACPHAAEGGVLATKNTKNTKAMKPSGVAWLGDIPDGWEVDLIGSFYSQRNEKVSDRDYPPLSVTMKGVLPQLATVAKTDDGDNRKLVKKGDFAINSRSDRRGSCGISECDGSVSLINTILMPRGEMEPRYYNWLFHTDVFSDEFYKWGHGIVDDLWTTRWSEMKRIQIVRPPLPEQRAIADYLDEKCGAIDAAIAEAKKGIEEYKVWKKSLIFEAVTGKRRVGIFNAEKQRCGGAEKMKSSGIPWIGAIPEGWELARLKNCAKVFGRIGFRGYTTADIVNEGEGALSLSPSNLKDIRMDYTKRTYISWSKYEESPEIKVCKGDIVFVKTGSSYGKACIVDDMPCEATLNPQLVVLKVFSCHNRYLNYYLQTPLIKYQVELIVSGGTIPTMSQEKMGGWKIILPPLPEQQAIADYLDEKCAAIDAMVAEKEILIADLEAYKKSLIYETVTGKREVA